MLVCSRRPSDALLAGQVGQLTPYTFLLAAPADPAAMRNAGRQAACVPPSRQSAPSASPAAETKHKSVEKLQAAGLS